jgi:Tol biopolymer transport system component
MTSPSQAPRRLGVLGTALVALVAPVALAGPAFASSTANEVVYSADDNNDGIYSVVLRDLESRRVSTVLPADTTNQWIYDEPELSPNGQQVALSTDRGGGDALIEGIAVVNRDGSGFRRLTSPPSTDTTTATTFSLDVSAAWSPDSTRLVFTRVTVTTPKDQTQPETVDTTLLTVPVAGGAAAPQAGAENGYTADWSPDGSKIVFADVDNATTDDSGPLTVVNSNGSGGAVLLGVSGYSPAWSPDGSTIAYAAITARDSDRVRAEDTAQIATVPATGGSQRVLAPTKPGSVPTVAEYPAWTPDGESIVYDLYGYSTTDDFPPGDLWAVDREGVRAGRVTTTAGDEAQPHVHGPAASGVSAGTASTYTAVTPKRILDTRSGLGGTSTKVGAGRSIDLQVHGVQTAEGLVPANASAVVLNLTVTGTTSNTDIRAYPAGTPVPGASNLNAAQGQTVPNLVTVRIGTGGAISLYNSGGTVHLIADIAGYYTPDAAGSGFAALTPTRIADSRAGVGCVSNKIPAGGFCDLQITGANGVPADARAVVLNVTATGATASTDVRVYPTPTDGSVPEVSNLNVRKGQTAPNLVTVAIGAGGKVRMRNAAGAVDLIADLAGYYSASAPGRFVPVAPTRFLDTRSGVGGAPIPVTASGYVDLKVAGTRGVPAGATAAVLNLTGTGVSASTDVRAYPVGVSTVPEVSNLNLTRGVTRANLAIVKTGSDGRIRVRNGAGSVNLIGDLAGYMVG